MKYHFLLISCLLLLGVAACSEEDSLVADVDTMTNYFAPDPNATDEVSVLRREFYTTEKSYLLFTDTLRREELGVDFNGDMQYLTETLDMGYTIGNSMSVQYKTYTYEYLQTLAEKEASATFLKEYVLPHLPVSLRPFSWFPVYSIMDNTTYTNFKALSGQRSIAVAVGYSISDLSADEKEQLANVVLTTTLGSAIQSKTKELTSFYEVCEGLYNEYFDTSDNPDYDPAINMQSLKKAGFIVQPNVWGFPITGKYPDKTLDTSSFTEFVLNNSQSEVESLYEGYPKVILKAQIMREIIKQLGYIY